MSNGEICCLMSVCCPPFSEEQTASLAREMVKSGVCDKAHATPIAEWMLKTYDLAPQGTLQPLVQAVADAVRKADSKKD